MASVKGIEVNDELFAFVQKEVAPEAGKSAEELFGILGELVRELGPKNQQLLDIRCTQQQALDAFFRDAKKAGRKVSDAEFETFLHEKNIAGKQKPIDFKIGTKNLDEEMFISGPELVVPVDKAGMVLNAANARWGSLDAAFVNTDVTDTGLSTEERRVQAVKKRNAFLDAVFPLTKGSYNEFEGKRFDTAWLRAPQQFIGHIGKHPLLENNGLKVELALNEEGAIADVWLESAITSIIDFEDSVSVVPTKQDTSDLVRSLGNWAKLMAGTLAEKGKSLKPLRSYKDKQGREHMLKSQSLLLVRDVGMHMFTDAVTVDGKPVPERLLGTLFTTVITASQDKGKNSKTGAIYHVCPKMHGAAEVAFNVELFAAIEKKLGLPEGTNKIGIMDEEFRTTAELGECLRAARARVFFCNTGFLDHTASHIRTHFYRGAILPKADMLKAVYNTQYEKQNVDLGIQSGLHKAGKIGAGMFTKVRKMQELLETKGAQVKAGNNTAWCPSPAAATLHATHYHETSVAKVQIEHKPVNVPLCDLAAFPGLERELSDKERKEYATDWAQSTLGYVIHWVKTGVGCSAIPDIRSIELMEDRATLRIHSALLANWLQHGIISAKELHAAFIEVAKVVDGQNKQPDSNFRPGYAPIAADGVYDERALNDNAVAASLALVEECAASDCAYVEPVLNRYRVLEKEKQRTRKVA